MEDTLVASALIRIMDRQCTSALRSVISMVRNVLILYCIEENHDLLDSMSPSTHTHMLPF